MPLLQIENLTIFFGGLRAVHDFRFTIEQGQVRGLIGPNGAGKTTIFNLITGIHKPTEGKIILDGKDIVGFRPNEIAAMGIGRTFQNMRLWRHMTILEHIKMARYSKLDYGLVGAFFGTSLRHKEEADVEMARAMAMEPKLLLLDEPTAGMNPEELSEMVTVIRQIKREFDVAIFLIEHRMKVVMELCERIQTLDFGEVIAEGTPEEIRSNPRVIDAYLGKEAEI
ncbi:MAG: ABC transporter ATP-binding protein [Anaerolineales bacterium]